MKDIDKEIERHRLDRDFTDALILCDIRLEDRDSRIQVQRRLDIICASINSSDRKEELIAAVRAAVSGYRRINFTLDGEDVRLTAVLPLLQNTRSRKGLVLKILIVAVTVATVLLLYLGGIIRV